MTVRTICAGLSVLCVCGVLAGVAANSDQASKASTPVGSPDQATSGARRMISGHMCGNAVCDAGETCVSCAGDCGQCDPPIVEVVVRDSTGPDNPLGTKSCQVLLHLNAPGDELVIVGNADIFTDDPDGFFQFPAPLGRSTSPPCDFIPFSPDLAQDSYVTFQVECDDGTDTTTLAPIPDWDDVAFNTEGRVAGSWFNFGLDNTQGLPDAEGNVLIAQFTMGESHSTCGTLTAFVRGDFGLPAPACPDLDGSDDVRVPDMIILFGSWGSCPGCPADFNGDDQVDVFDLLILFGGWGPCGEDPLPVVGFPVSFECPGSTCIQEIPTISKWSQLPHEPISNCCRAHGSAGCDDSVCQAAVCDVEPSCCDVEWTESCAIEAKARCDEVCRIGFNIASDVDWQTLDKQPSGSPGPGPNWVAADDFISDGRPITAVRWWGSYLDLAFVPSINMSVQGPSSADRAEQLPSGTRAAMLLGSNCCEANGGNGCDDQECQDLVCFLDPLCCLDPPFGWNQSCADSAQGLCTICGVSDCCTIRPDETGCDDPSCESIVCAQDPTCCDTQWGINCLLLALGSCQACIPDSSCGDLAAGGCCTANGTGGCDDEACCNAVCTNNPELGCCFGPWTQACADAAQASPFCSCEIGPVCPGGGDCFNPNPTPGCQDASCCETVCAALPSCCEAPWDELCAQAAFDLCAGTEVDGWLISFHADDPTLEHPDTLLGLYSCPAAAVQIMTTEITGWDEHSVFEYFANLQDCCLLHAEADSRDVCPACDCDLDGSGACDDDDRAALEACIGGMPGCPDVNCDGVSDDPDDLSAFDCLRAGGEPGDCCQFNEIPPARDNDFREVGRFLYWLDIQAVVGHSAEPSGLCPTCVCDLDGDGECSAAADLLFLLGCLGDPDCPDLNCDGLSNGADVDVFTCLTKDPPEQCCPSGLAGNPCTVSDTINRADDHFWGWHTSALACFDNSAMGELVMGPLGEWVYQNWTPVDGSEHMLDRVDQAFELLTLVDSCPWDVAGGPENGPDGQVRVPDLILLLANWGPYRLCEQERLKPMDFNANFTVRVPDLIAMLAHWGRCPCEVGSDCPSNDCQDNLCVPLD